MKNEKSAEKVATESDFNIATRKKTNQANIKLDKLQDFEDHPYKVQDDEAMEELKASIKEFGLLNRILVRSLDDGDGKYEIIAGHRRVHAAKALGLKELPAIIYPIDHDEATLLMVDSNNQRENVSIMEKGRAYRMKYEAMKHQGKTSSHNETKCRSDELVAENSGESRATVQRYIRLTYLIPQLLDLMDENKIAFSVGVELSYLDDQSQFDVLEQCEQNDCTPSYSQAVRMHKAVNDGTLDKDFIIEIMSEEKANQRETYRIPAERLRGKIPSSYTAQQREDYIVKAVEYYQKFLQRQRETGR